MILVLSTVSRLVFSSGRFPDAPKIAPIMPLSIDFVVCSIRYPLTVHVPPDLAPNLGIIFSI